MERFAALKHVAFALVIAIVIYFGFFFGIEHLRTRKGPWRVTFTTEGKTPVLLVNEPALGIDQVKIVFPKASVQTTNATLPFAQPQEVPFELPFGQCVFEDTTFQPGTIVFKLFGQEVQLLPRVLTINGREYPWQSNQTIAVTNLPSGETNTAAQ
jgi:hypothetical protein